MSKKITIEDLYRQIAQDNGSKGAASEALLFVEARFDPNDVVTEKTVEEINDLLKEFAPWYGTARVVDLEALRASDWRNALSEKTFTEEAQDMVREAYKLLNQQE